MPQLLPSRPAPSPGSRTWTVQGRAGAVDLAVTAPDDATLADVLPGVRAATGEPDAALWAGSTELPPATALTAPELGHGAVLGLGRPGPRGAESGSGAVELQVTAGPDAGSSLALGRRPVVIGRGGSSDVPVADPDVSRRHVAVAVADGRVTVADLGSRNGTRLTGPAGPVPLPVGPVPWPVGTSVLLGGSAVRLTGPQGGPVDCTAAPAGRLRVRGLRSARAPLGETVVAVPAAPADPPRRKLGLVAVAVPTVGGLAMAWVFGTPQFLFFSLLGPLVAVGTWCSDRLSGRRSGRRAREEHAAALGAAERAVAAAVAAEVSAREERAPDLARLASAARRRSTPLFSRTAADDDALLVRLGAGPGTTRVVRRLPGGERAPVVADRLPVAVDLARSGGLAVTGPRGPLLGVARSLLCQLGTLLPPTDLQLVLVTGPTATADWRWARWLPHLRVTCSPAEAAEAVTALLPARAGTAGSTAAGPWTVVLLDGPGGGELAAAVSGRDRVVLVELARDDAGVTAGAPTRLELTGELGTAGRLSRPGPGTGAEPVPALDGVSGPTAARVARDLAPLWAPPPGGDLPADVRLLELGGTTDWPADRGSLHAVLGVGEAGPVEVDLVAQGPHALVAGTTGSGKSELLQTLVASLARHHPPDRCSFLLVDYKGGAAFAEAAALPHTAGLLTDLDPQSTERALRSLTAELVRREELLAAAGARDVTDLPAGVALARLVIVVDEFATLAEDLPGFLSGLVGIAQRGRSLGVHLVLATQRPAGVVSPEIRANCSLRLCLRTTDETDARDVLGSPLPAGLPVTRPGRGYLRSGSTEPVLLQVARVSGTAPPDPDAVLVRPVPWPPPVAGPGSRTTARPTGGSDLARLVAELRTRSTAEGRALPPRPWLPPLPDRLSAGATDPAGDGSPAEVLTLGLVDRPDRQVQEPLHLDLAAGGSWLLVGGPRSGRTSALRAVLAEAVHRLPPDRVHVHVLDAGDGSLAASAGALPHTGTAVPRDDPYRSVRLVARLQEEVDRRRAGPGGSPPLLLLVDGLEALSAQLDEADPTTGSAALLRLVRDGAAAGLTTVLTAERAVPGSRVSAAVTTRLVLPLPDRADYAVAGYPARLVPAHRPPGRALVGEEGAECQLVLPREPLVPASAPATAPALPGAGGPLRLVRLPADPLLPLPRGPVPGLLLPLGPGGDEGDPVVVDLARTGGLLVGGPPGSGRSATLAAVGAWCTAAGVPVVALTDAPDPAARAAPAPPRIDRADAEGLRRWTAALTGSGVVLVDDAAALPDATADALAALSRPVGRLLPVVTGSVPDLAATHRGPVVGLRRSRAALLLRPAAGEAELLGLRLPRMPVPPRPGAGWLVTGGAVTRVQVARHRPAVATVVEAA
ncbi:FtsK/SpoIIIE domain-containing protein [Modestobacter sp. NPDC049651]|uniref:FtsK/SpoIIIE domain-containing protein n=1 Tax=unclassified Modestobacter TaxID=2643866 RepID=UPI0033F01B04